MKVTHRYLLAEIAGPYLISLFTFSLVVLLQRFTRLADLVVAKGVPAIWVGRMLLGLFPTFLQITLPAALLLSVLLALGRMSADSELVALRTAGVGMRGLLLPVLLLGSATFLASLWIGWWGIPWGPIYTIGAVVTNLGGGKDVTQDVLRAINATAARSSSGTDVG